MTWLEICDELVKRWPDRFEIIYEYPMTKTIRIDTAKWSVNEYSVDDITEICGVIGVKIWSTPTAECDGKWRGAYDTDETGMRFSGDSFDTRHAAELSALGAWLEVTR